MAAKCRALSTLVLAGAVVCLDGLLALSELKNLARLDLSYTEIDSLEPIFCACTQLKVGDYEDQAWLWLLVSTTGFCS